MGSAVEWWTFGAEALGAVGTIAATWIAVTLAKRAREEANELRDRERRRLAVRISARVSRTFTTAPGQVVEPGRMRWIVDVRNYSEATIYDVVAHVHASTGNVAVGTPMIEPGSSAHMNSEQLNLANEPDPEMSVWFQDAHGLSWMRTTSDGHLVEVTHRPPLPLQDDPYSPPASR